MKTQMNKTRSTRAAVHLKLVDSGEAEAGHIAKKARRERETKHPRYRALIDLAIAKAGGKA